MQDIEKLAIECGLLQTPTAFDLKDNPRVPDMYKRKVEQLEAFAKAIQGDGEPVYQICFDGNGNWVDVPSCEYEKEWLLDKRIVYTTTPNTQYKLDKAIEALERLDGWLKERNLGGLMPDELEIIAMKGE